jgi:hypothetical protein
MKQNSEIVVPGRNVGMLLAESPFLNRDRSSMESSASVQNREMFLEACRLWTTLSRS